MLVVSEVIFNDKRCHGFRFLLKPILKKEFGFIV